MSEVLHPEEVITTLILIRHGHTEQTESGLLYADPNAKLTARGESQASSVGEWLPREQPEVLLTSPSLRVRSSAGIIAAQIGLQESVVPKLDEWQVGEWEGLTYLHVKKNQPEAYAAWCKDPIRNAPPGGESVADMCQRVDRQIHTVLTEHQGKKIALVTHAGVIRAIVVQALGMPVDNFWRVSVPTGSVSKIDFSSNFATVHYLAIRPDVHATRHAY